jgi:hypothetical protein
MRRIAELWKRSRRAIGLAGFTVMLAGLVLGLVAVAPGQAAPLKATGTAATAATAGTAAGAAGTTEAAGTPGTAGAAGTAKPAPALTGAAATAPRPVVVPNIPGPRLSCAAAKLRCTGSSNSLFSSNWSGYVQTGGSYTSVSATWTVPTARSTGNNQTDSSTWVGIDGWGNSNLIQTGTEQGWNGASAYYRAWYEILPANETISFNVSPGDNIYATVRQLSGTQWQMYLTDLNSGATISQTATYTGQQASAEFIQEAPSLNGVEDKLASTTNVSFYNARVNGAAPQFTDSQQIVMDPNGTVQSTPSEPNQAENAFIVASAGATPAGPPSDPLFQLHNDNSVWASTGVTCSSGACPGWNEIDHNTLAVQLAAGDGTVFERRSNGSVWEWTGGACQGSVCDGWVPLDHNATTINITAGAGNVFELHTGGAIWRATGLACPSTVSCPGWQELDTNAGTVQISAGAATLFQRHSDGSVWQSTGAACAANCPGWTEIDSTPTTSAISAGSDTVYEMRSDHSIWRYTGSGWADLDNDAGTSAISAGGGTVYLIRTNGAIWRWTGAVCTSASSCPGWTLINNNPSSSAIRAGATTVYEIQSDSTHSIWESTGTACVSTASCPGWVQLDNNPAAVDFSASNGSLN